MGEETAFWATRMNEERYQEGTSIRFKGAWFSQKTVRSIIFSWRTPRFQGQERRLSKTEVVQALHASYFRSETLIWGVYCWVVWAGLPSIKINLDERGKVAQRPGDQLGGYTVTLSRNDKEWMKVSRCFWSRSDSTCWLIACGGSGREADGKSWDPCSEWNRTKGRSNFKRSNSNTYNNNNDDGPNIFLK